MNYVSGIQEVVADDTAAIDVVLNSDEKRTALLKQKEEIEQRLEHKSKKNDLDKLNEVYDDLRAIGADQAEPKARRWARFKHFNCNQMKFYLLLIIIHFFKLFYSCS